jgi:hypothetical protein
MDCREDLNIFFSQKACWAPQNINKNIDAHFSNIDISEIQPVYIYLDLIFFQNFYYHVTRENDIFFRIFIIKW